MLRSLEEQGLGESKEHKKEQGEEAIYVPEWDTQIKKSYQAIKKDGSNAM